MPPTMDERRELMERVTRKLVGRLGDELQELKRLGIGVTIFAFELGENGALAYISTAERAGMIGAVKEWVAYQEAGLTTEPRGERGRS